MVPTIGRRVYFFYTEAFITAAKLTSLDLTQPFDAGILFVLPNGNLIVQVTDHQGKVECVENIPLITESGEHGNPCWVEWMPYQKEQHEKQAQST